MYTKSQLSAARPGLILILIDQSKSMEDTYIGGQSKAEFAALVINRCIYEIIKGCAVGDVIKDRCHLGIIGYGGGTADVIVGGTASEVHGKQLEKQTVMRQVSDGAGGLIEVPIEMSIWVKPIADGGTPMAAAFRKAHEIAQPWVEYNNDNFPPVVINITDGAPGDASTKLEVAMADAETAARELLGLGTSDGTLILLNAHISQGGGSEIILPNLEPADLLARFLYNISSVLPPPLVDAAKNQRLNPMPGARGCIFNAGAENFIKLLTFGSNNASNR